MKREPPPFATEAEMCAYFIAHIGPQWTAYPETEEWDILLVRKADGFQIGIQAKLRLNADVLKQAAEDWHSWQREEEPGPDCRAVLVPNTAAGNLLWIAGRLGLTVICVRILATNVRGYEFQPQLPSEAHDYGWNQEWHEQLPTRRHPLPEYVPDVAAGASGPLKLTKWKIAAIKIAVTLEHRGFVTRQDFTALGIDYRRWLPSAQGWLEKSDNGFVAGAAMPDFRKQHPRVYEEVAADYEKWAAKAVLLAKQGALL